MQINEERKQLLDTQIEKTMKLLNILIEVRAGKSLTSVLDKYGISYINFNRYINSKLLADNEEPLKYDEMTLTGAEDLWKALMEVKSLYYVPSDVDVTMEKLIKTALTPKEAKIIRMRHWENMTFEKIGEKLNVSNERARQLLLRAYDKLKKGGREYYIQFGDSYYRKIKDKRLEEEINNKNLQIKKLEKILNNHERRLGRIINDWTDKEIDTSNLREDLDIEIEKLDMSNSLYNLLKRNGINTLEDILDTPLERFRNMRNMGNVKIEELSKLIEEFGINGGPV